MAEVVNGRLVIVDDHLYLQPEDAQPLHDDEGVLRDDLVEVAYDPGAGGYVKVNPGEPSHNERHHKQFVDMASTVGNLFDETGKLVVQADPHHFAPDANDPHVDGLEFMPDEIAPRQTGHTEAYEGKHEV